MARVLVLNQYYVPDTTATARYVTAIAERLAGEGHAVEAIAGQPSYSEGLDEARSRERRNGVLITRIGLGRSRGRERMTRRLAGYLRFMTGVLFTAARRRADVILCFHNPPPLVFLAVAIARLRGAAVVYVPQDIHPDILVASGFLRLPSGVRRAWDALNRVALERADRTIALGEGMRETLLEKGASPERVVTIPLWAEPELEVSAPDPDVRERFGTGDRLLVLYAGNMGVMHPLEPVLQAAGRLRDEPISFLFVGDGVRRSHWERRAEELALTNIRFLDYQASGEFARLVAAADVGLVSLDLGMERLAVPSRSFAFFSAGLPVIAHMARDADIARIVEDAGAGWHTWTPEEVTDLLCRLCANRAEVSRAGAAARAVFEERFRRVGVTRRYAEIVDCLVPVGGSGE